MLQDGLNKLRDKSEATREAVAVWVSLGITAIIALIWITSIPNILARSTGDTYVANETHESFQAQVISSVDVTGDISNFRDELTELLSEEPYANILIPEE